MDAEANEDLVDQLEPTAWGLVAAVQAGSAERVARLVAECPRLDVVAIILAAQLPRRPRQRLDGRGEVECGTDDGYREHLKRDETTCSACRDAHARRNAGYRADARRRDRAPARAVTLQAVAMGERPPAPKPPTWSAYVGVRALERAESRWVLHAMSVEGELAGHDAPQAECGRETQLRTGDWNPEDPRNCSKCSRIVRELTGDWLQATA